MELDKWIRDQINDGGRQYYILIDEIQFVSEILTQFRDRGDEIRVYPLSFAEFYEAYRGDKRGAWQDYYTYGGMPVITILVTHEEKSRYLNNLLEQTYLNLNYS